MNMNLLRLLLCLCLVAEIEKDRLSATAFILASGRQKRGQHRSLARRWRYDSSNSFFQPPVPRGDRSLLRARGQQTHEIRLKAPSFPEDPGDMTVNGHESVQMQYRDLEEFVETVEGHKRDGTPLPSVQQARHARQVLSKRVSWILKVNPQSMLNKKLYEREHTDFFVTRATKPSTFCAGVLSALRDWERLYDPVSDPDPDRDSERGKMGVRDTALAFRLVAVLGRIVPEGWVRVRNGGRRVVGRGVRGGGAGDASALQVRRQQMTNELSGLLETLERSAEREEAETIDREPGQEEGRAMGRRSSLSFLSNAEMLSVLEGCSTLLWEWGSSRGEFLVGAPIGFFDGNQVDVGGGQGRMGRGFIKNGWKPPSGDEHRLFVRVKAFLERVKKAFRERYDRLLPLKNGRMILRRASEALIRANEMGGPERQMFCEIVCFDAVVSSEELKRKGRAARAQAEKTRDVNAHLDLVGLASREFTGLRNSLLLLTDTISDTVEATGGGGVLNDKVRQALSAVTGWLEILLSIDEEIDDAWPVGRGPRQDGRPGRPSRSAVCTNVLKLLSALKRREESRQASSSLAILSGRNGKGVESAEEKEIESLRLRLSSCVRRLLSLIVSGGPDLQVPSSTTLDSSKPPRVFGVKAHTAIRLCQLLGESGLILQETEKKSEEDKSEDDANDSVSFFLIGVVDVLPFVHRQTISHMVRSLAVSGTPPPPSPSPSPSPPSPTPPALSAPSSDKKAHTDDSSRSRGVEGVEGTAVEVCRAPFPSGSSPSKPWALLPEARVLCAAGIDELTNRSSDLSGGATVTALISAVRAGVSRNDHFRSILPKVVAGEGFSVGQLAMLLWAVATHMKGAGGSIVFGQAAAGRQRMTSTRSDRLRQRQLERRQQEQKQGRVVGVDGGLGGGLSSSGPKNEDGLGERRARSGRVSMDAVDAPEELLHLASQKILDRLNEGRGASVPVENSEDKSQVKEGGEVATPQNISYDDVHSRLKPNDVAMVSWALAVTGRLGFASSQYGGVFETWKQLAKEALRSNHEQFSPRDFTLTVWALAVRDQSDLAWVLDCKNAFKNRLAVMLGRLQENHGERGQEGSSSSSSSSSTAPESSSSSAFAPQEIALLLWVFWLTRAITPDIVQDALAVALGSLRRFTPQGLCFLLQAIHAAALHLSGEGEAVDGTTGVSQGTQSVLSAFVDSTAGGKDSGRPETADAVSKVFQTMAERARAGHMNSEDVLYTSVALRPLVRDLMAASGADFRFESVAGLSQSSEGSGAASLGLDEVSLPGQRDFLEWIVSGPSPCSDVSQKIPPGSRKLEKEAEGGVGVKEKGGERESVMESGSGSSDSESRGRGRRGGGKELPELLFALTARAAALRLDVIPQPMGDVLQLLSFMPPLSPFSRLGRVDAVKGKERTSGKGGVSDSHAGGVSALDGIRALITSVAIGGSEHLQRLRAPEPSDLLTRALGHLRNRLKPHEWKLVSERLERSTAAFRPRDLLQWAESLAALVALYTRVSGFPQLGLEDEREKEKTLKAVHSFFREVGAAVLGAWRVRDETPPTERVAALPSEAPGYLRVRLDASELCRICHPFLIVGAPTDKIAEALELALAEEGAAARVGMEMETAVLREGLNDDSFRDRGGIRNRRGAFAPPSRMLEGDQERLQKLGSGERLMPGVSVQNLIAALIVLETDNKLKGEVRTLMAREAVAEFYSSREVGAEQLALILEYFALEGRPEPALARAGSMRATHLGGPECIPPATDMRIRQALSILAPASPPADSLPKPPSPLTSRHSSRREQALRDSSVTLESSLRVTASRGGERENILTEASAWTQPSEWVSGTEGIDDSEAPLLFKDHSAETSQEGCFGRDGLGSSPWEWPDAPLGAGSFMGSGISSDPFISHNEVYEDHWEHMSQIEERKRQLSSQIKKMKR